MPGVMSEKTRADMPSFRVLASRGVALCAALTLMLAIQSSKASASPASLSRDLDVAAFAGLIKAYAGASRVDWVVAAPTLAQANSIIENIGLHLSSNDQYLLQRLRARSAADSPTVAEASAGPVGWIEPQSSRAAGGPNCSWQIWVADPATPSAGAAPANVPLAPNDRMPVGSAATFRIGYTGLIQSKIYAFGETEPGAIRDLAQAPDVNIPVAAGENETIVLAMSRQPTPFLETIRAALATSGGRRLALGADHTLTDKLRGRGRGIGANIQLLGPNMVVTKSNKMVVANNDARPVEPTETCQFLLTPAAEAMR
jgi:hypothetical protein